MLKTRLNLPTITPAAAACTRPSTSRTQTIVAPPFSWLIKERALLTQDSLWITLSSSVILFNKWILTSAKFGMSINVRSGFPTSLMSRWIEANVYLSPSRVP